MQQLEAKISGALKTWGLMVALLVVGASAVALGLPRPIALKVIFGAAIAQSFVIGRYYMQLRSEDLLIYVLALLPPTLVIILALVIGPEFNPLRHVLGG